MTVRLTFVALFVGVVCLCVFLLLPARGFSGVAVSQRLVEPFDASEVMRIELSAGAGTLAIMRTESGWGLANGGGYPVYADRAERLLLDLSETTVLEQRTDDPSFHDRLGVGDSGLHIRLIAADGRTVADVVAGRFVEARGIFGRLVRKAGEDRVKWIEQSLPGSTALGEWADLTLLDIEPSRIDAIRITHPDGGTVALSAADTERAGEIPMIIEAPLGPAKDHPALLRLPLALARLSFGDVNRVDAFEFTEEQTVTTEFETTDGLVIEVQTVPVTPETAAARFRCYSIDDERADEAEALDRRLSPWVFRIAAARAIDMRLRPEELRGPSLEDLLGPALPGR